MAEGRSLPTKIPCDSSNMTMRGRASDGCFGQARQAEVRGGENRNNGERKRVEGGKDGGKIRWSEEERRRGELQSYKSTSEQT